MKKITVYFVAGLVVTGLFTACSGNKLQHRELGAKTAIQPPFKGIDVEVDYHTINASKDNVIRTAEGTVITIPANSLVDAKGKKITGKVEVMYRSINKPSEIIVSGIPMVYDSAGVKNDFVSAGMFEIGAKQAGKEVFVEKGKSLAVDFASYTPGSDFNFYKIDKKSGSWSYLGTNEPGVNVGKQEKLNDFEDDNLIEFDIDYSVHDELKEFDGLKWLCIDKDDAVNPSKNDWILQENWWDIDLKTIDSKDGIYQVSLSNPNNKATFKVTPYFLDNEVKDVAAMNDKINLLHETVKIKKAEEQRIQMEADITRSFSIPSFGLYNWDKIEKEVAAGLLSVTNASFSIDSKNLTENRKVFHFSGGSKLLSREVSKWEKLTFKPEEKNAILVVLPNNEIAISTESDFRSAKGTKNFLFTLKRHSKKIHSIADLDAILAKL